MIQSFWRPGFPNCSPYSDGNSLRSSYLSIQAFENSGPIRSHLHLGLKPAAEKINGLAQKFQGMIAQLPKEESRVQPQPETTQPAVVFSPARGKVKFRQRVVSLHLVINRRAWNRRNDEKRDLVDTLLGQVSHEVSGHDQILFSLARITEYKAGL